MKALEGREKLVPHQRWTEFRNSNIENNCFWRDFFTLNQELYTLKEDEHIKKG